MSWRDGSGDHSAYQPEICRYRPGGALEGAHGRARDTLTSVPDSSRSARRPTPTYRMRRRPPSARNTYRLVAAEVQRVSREPVAGTAGRERTIGGHIARPTGSPSQLSLERCLGPYSDAVSQECAERVNAVHVPRFAGINEDVLHMRRLNVRGWLVIELSDLPDLKSRAGQHVGAIRLRKAQTTHSLVEIVATDADVIATHPCLRHDEHSFHGAKCSIGIWYSIARRSAIRLR